MDVDGLRKSPIGELVPISGTDPRTGLGWSYWAFVPQPLPASPTLGARAANIAGLAAMEVARLDQAVSQLPRPEILVRPTVRREAASTSALEGTYASFDDVLEADFLDDRQLTVEQREIRNYVTATDQAVELIKTYPISRNLAGRLQATIVKGTQGDSFDAGDIRQRQVAIGPKNRPIEEARFVPVPGDDRLVQGMSDWEKWVNRDDDFMIVARMAMAHYQFETLHPFADGNGRLGRLIAILQLMQDGVLRWPVLNLAPWLEQRRDVYQQGLLDVTLTGDFDPWIEFFAEAVHVQARAGVQKITQLLILRDSIVEDLRVQGVKGTALHLAEFLIGYPVLDVPTARILTGKGFETANQAVAKLVDKGLLVEITGKRQNRLFVCRQVLNVTQFLV
ncbi:Fic family protein [Antrihabitans cavernicola]|uniref:Fic family protein n=1 Tax=Antrihabitans cavernicola TaxID=2495913 RepID=A0A5A7SFG6_9NOCA|nr:Fic/DOC family N-terminal domain-containing protein [Spelaeibacter cavernicola]KAA0024566.1 Fic family protein [Spelaeibacter cavernicola]